MCVRSQRLKRIRNSGTLASTYRLEISVKTPNAKMIRSGVIFRMSLVSQSTPDASMMATVLKKLLTAITRPRSLSSARCCISALSGTTNRPPKNPTTVRFRAAIVNDDPEPARNNDPTPIPIAPIGARPGSTLSPDNRPAAMLPAPMPTAANVVRMPTQRSLRCITSAPKRIITSWSSAPRNQK